MSANELKFQFQVIEDNLNGAYEKNDVGKISDLLSDDWTILETSTGLSGKTQFLNAIKNRSLIHSSMKKDVLEVKFYADFAIVITRGRNKGHYLDKPFNTELWVTNIYKKTNLQWVCVMTQECPVAC